MSEESNITARRGKIARLPLAIRELVNERLLEGQSARQILPWLNALPGVKTFLTAEYNGDPVNDQNLTAWRHGGYAEWLTRRDRVERTKELARYAAKQSKANGASIAEGGAAIAAGKLLELLELVDEETGARLPTDELVSIASALASLRTSEQNDVRLGQNEKKLAQKDEEIKLARERFQRDTCELFLKWHAEKSAIDVANGDGSNADKIERLGQLMFGETWRPAPEKK